MESDAAFWNWFAGFVDGEGCFSVRMEKDPRVNYNTARPAFSLLLRDDDREIVEEIADRIGREFVRVKARPASTNKAGVTSKPSVFLDVRSKRGCQRIVSIFDTYPLRAKKKNDFEIWRQIVLELQHQPRGNRWDGPADKTRLFELTAQLVEGRKYKEEVPA